MATGRTVISTIALAFTLGACHGAVYCEAQMSEQGKTSSYATATFAGGCFWCMEAAFEGIDGIVSAVSGYTGGRESNPSYENVSTGRTGHVEAVEVKYDPQKIPYAKLLEIFWQNINPTQADGQFADRGPQYRSVIFYHDDEQKRLAEESKKALEQSRKFDKPIVTKIEPASAFYPAEEYHQNYHKKNPAHYKMYKYGSGRAPYLEQTWRK